MAEGVVELLYISRFIGLSKFGVVDTDDNTESIVTYKELSEYCIDLGMDIKGVTLHTVHSRGRQKLGIQSVNVYQNAGTVTRDQAKLKLLRGVDIKNYGGRIVSVDVDVNVIPKDLCIRLSDYGTSCGEYMFKGMPYTRMKLLTLIVDEKVEVNGKSFKHFIDRGVCLDMREVTSKKTVDYVAREVASTSRVIPKVYEAVIDEPNRLDYYIAMHVLNRSYNDGVEITNIGDITKNPANVNRVVAKRFKREFDSISKAKFVAIKNNQWATTAKAFSQWLANPLNAGLMTFHDYESLRMSRFIDIFKVLRELSTCNKSVLLRFENYVKYFDAPPDIQQAYINLCESAGNWLLSYAKQVHWVR